MNSKMENQKREVKNNREITQRRYDAKKNIMNSKMENQNLKIFPPWPHYDEDEVAAAMQVLQSGQVNYWTGQEGRQFEEAYAASVGTKYAIALMNGSVALEAALVALGMAPGDEVVVTSRTFIASASCVIMRGGRPVMADVDPVSQNLTAETIAAALTPRTRGIIVVHLAGWPCDMDPIMNLAREKGLWVVEDCAQANGATYKGRQVGSMGDVAAFSFCQDKIITTGGEGGMVTTNRHDIWDKIWSYKDHGIKGGQAFLIVVKCGLRFTVYGYRLKSIRATPF